VGLHVFGNAPAQLPQRPLEPRQLTAAIQRCTSFAQLGDLYHCSLSQFDHIHHTAFIVQCVRVLERAHLRRLPPEFLHVFSSAVATFADHISMCGPRELSTYVWALSKARADPSSCSCTLALIQQQLLADGGQLLRACRSHDLANLAWGYAKLMYNEPTLWDQLALVATAAMPNCRPQEVANIAWAYGRMRHPSHALLKAAAKQLEQRSTTFSAQHICNITWAHAALRFPNPQLLRTVAFIAPRRRHYFTAQGVANLLWSYARLGKQSDGIFKVFTKQAQRLAPRFSPTGLSCVLWAISVSGYRDRNTPYVLRAIIHEFRTKSDRFQAADLAMFVRALARIKRPSKAVLLEVARQAVAKIGTFKPGTLACCVWGFVSASCTVEGLFRVFAQRAYALLRSSRAAPHPQALHASRQPGSFTPQQLLLLALAFCGRPTCKALLPLIADELTPSSGSLSAQNKCLLLQALAAAGCGGHPLSTALQQQLPVLLPALPVEQLCGTVVCLSQHGAAGPAALGVARAAVQQHLRQLLQQPPLLGAVLAALEAGGSVNEPLVSNLVDAFHQSPRAFDGAGFAALLGLVAAAEHADKQVWHALLAAALPRVRDLSGASVCTAAAAFSSAGQYDVELFVMLAEAAVRRFEEVSPRDASRLLHALLHVGHCDMELQCMLRQRIELGA
jgi:hypothetical protein